MAEPIDCREAKGRLQDYLKRELTPELAARTATFSRDDLLARLEAAGVPGSRLDCLARLTNPPRASWTALRMVRPIDPSQALA